MKKLKNIYGKYLRKKKLYYFLKYYNIVTQINTNELIHEFNININNGFLPYNLYVLNNDDKNENLNLYNNKYVNSYSQLIPDSNLLMGYPINDDNNPIFSKTERIPLKNQFQINNFKKVNKNYINYINNDEKGNYLDMIMKNSSISNKNNNTSCNNNNKKSLKNRRTLSYGNFEVKMNRNNNIYNMFPIEDNNIIFNSSNNMNSTQSLKAIFPSYSITSPNGLIYPIIFANNNENYINNNNMNNNILYNYQENTPFNSSNIRRANTKPSFWYANVFSPINQIPIIQDNNYTFQISKYLNNSANFNSIPNVNNNYSEDYLNKQIYDFINSNNKTKQNIISNISKKHNIKLNKSNGAITINDTSNNKKLKRKNNSYYTMNIDESNQLISDRVNKEKSVKKIKDKSIKSKKKSIPKLFNGKEANDISDLIYTNNMSSPSDLLINKFKKKQNSKIVQYENSYNNNDSRFDGKYKKKINNIKNNYSNLNENKITKNNCSIEFNKKLLESQNDCSDETEKMNENSNINMINYNKIINNENEFSTQEENSDKTYNMNINTNSNTIPLIKNITSINSDYNSIKLNSSNNNKNIPIKNKNNILKKDKNNYNIQNVSKESFNVKTKKLFKDNNNISYLNPNKNKKMFDPSQYEISNVVDEEFINNEYEENEEEQKNSEINSLRMSLQSMNDSKILELANHYVNDDQILDKGKINDILNDKNNQKTVKKYKY